MKFKDELLLKATKKYGKAKLFKISTLIGESVTWVKRRLRYLEEYLGVDSINFENQNDNFEQKWSKEKDLKIVRLLKEFPEQYNKVGSFFGVHGETISNRIKKLQGQTIEEGHTELKIPIELAHARLENQKTRKELRREFLSGKKKKNTKKLIINKLEFNSVEDFLNQMPKPKFS